MPALASQVINAPLAETSRSTTRVVGGCLHVPLRDLVDPDKFKDLE